MFDFIMTFAASFVAVLSLPLLMRWSTPKLDEPQTMLRINLHCSKCGHRAAFVNLDHVAKAEGARDA